MKKFLLSFLFCLLLTASPAWAQGIHSFNSAAPASDVGIPQAQTAIAFHKLSWTTSGTVSTCTVALDTSADNSSWSAGGAISGQTCTSAGNSLVVAASANFVRITFTALSGGGNVTATWNGYVNNPSGAFSGGTGSSYQDVLLISAPSNPATGYIRLYGNSGTGNFTCLTAAGASCIASGTISGLTTGFMPKAASATSITNSLCDEGITTANVLTCAQTAGMTLSAGPLNITSDGTHAGAIQLVGNTTVPASFNSNSVGFIGPNSASFTSYFLQISSTAPSGNQAFVCGTPSSNVSTCTWGNTASSLDQLTGSAAQATNTETATGHEVTFAGVETANLTHPFSFTDANSTNNNTNGAVVIGTTGTSTGAVPLRINEATAAGNLLEAYNGGTVTNGVLSGGTLEFNVSATGALTAKLSLATGTAPAVTCGTGGCFSATEGTIATGLSTADTFSADSTHHCFDNNANNVDLGCVPGVTAAGLTSTAIVTAGANSFNLQTPSATSTLSSGGNMSLAGTLSVTTTVQASATNAALTVQAGQDATTQASTAALTVRGEDVTGGSTVTLTGGALTLRGGNNASTGNTSIGGAVTLAGGDSTGGTGTSDAGGAVTLRGGNCTSTTGGCTPGANTHQGGGFTAAFTNGQGADAILAGGLGTGNAVASHSILKHPTFSQTSGTTAQTSVTGYIRLAKAGSTTSATATNMFSVAAAAGQSAGGVVFVHVYTTQAAPHSCSDQGIWEYSAQGDTAPTANVNRVDASVTTICDTGTLTLTATMTNANPSVFSVTPTWTTIIPTAVWIEIIILNPSDVDITTISD